MSRELTILEHYGFQFGLPEVCDHQVTGSFQECRRMAYYKHGLGREMLHTDKTALQWGKAMHTCAEVWETTKDPEAVYHAIKANLDENISDRYGRTQGRMFEAFMKWVEFRQNNPVEIVRTEQPTAVSCYDGESCPYFADGCQLTYAGRLDNVVKWDSIIGPLDIKTTVMDETDPVSEYRPNHQFMGYVWVLSHLMMSHSWGIIVERIVTNKSKIAINRYPISFNKDQIREWVMNEIVLQAELRALAENHPYNEIAWTQNHFRCYKPYPCEFRDVCIAPMEMGFRYKFLRDNSREHRWDYRNPDQLQGAKNE